MLLLAACSPAADDPPPSPSPSPSATVEGGGVVPQDIVGEYRVAGIDGAPLNADFGIAVSISADTIGYDPRCLGFAWTYDLAEGLISTRRDPDYGPERADDGSVVSCLPAVGPEYRALAAAFDAAQQVRRTPENAIVFTGPDHSVTLFSQ